MKGGLKIEDCKIEGLLYRNINPVTLIVRLYKIMFMD